MRDVEVLGELRFEKCFEIQCRFSSSCFAAKFRHSIAQYIIDCGTFAAGNALLQGRYPSSDRIERRPYRLGSNDARDANVRRLFLARKQDFVQPLARTDAGKFYFDIATRFQPGEPDDPLGKVDDFYRLTHVKDIDRDVPVMLVECVTC